jgi:pSer/pThr/pTyr-binding forkhead associated (FHA) protein
MGTRRIVRDRIEIARFRLRVIAGPDAPQVIDSAAGDLNIGSGEGQHLRLSDPCVSRHHCVIRVSDDGVICEDLESTNGTFVSGHRIKSSVLVPGDTIMVGETELAVELLDGTISEPVSRSDRFGRVLGRSCAMRRVFGLLERVAGT